MIRDRWQITSFNRQLTCDWGTYPGSWITVEDTWGGEYIRQGVRTRIGGATYSGPYKETYEMQQALLIDWVAKKNLHA